MCSQKNNNTIIKCVINVSDIAKGFLKEERFQERFEATTTLLQTVIWEIVSRPVSSISIAGQ